MSWPIFRLDEVTEVAAGNPAPQESADFVENGDLFIRMQDVGREHHTADIRTSTDKISTETISKYRLRLFPVGSVLIPKSGASVNLNHRAMLGCDAYVVSHLAVVVPNLERLLPEYLYLWSLSYDPRSQAQTTSLPSLPLSLIKAASIPVPPIEEQRRIVDILSRAEGIVRLRREAEKKAADLIPALFLDMFGDPATNPKGWPINFLGEHVEIASAVKTPDLNQDANLPCIGADSIEGHTGKLISIPTVNDVRPISGKYQFKVGDVLYSKIRPYLAKASLAPCDGYCSADMYPLSCKPSLRADFLLALLLSKSFTDYATAESVRAQMPKLNRQTLFAYQFPVPSTELQELFEERANAIYSIQSQQFAATTKAQAAFDALLAQVFSK